MVATWVRRKDKKHDHRLGAHWWGGRGANSGELEANSDLQKVSCLLLSLFEMGPAV